MSKVECRYILLTLDTDSKECQIGVEWKHQLEMAVALAIAL